MTARRIVLGRPKPPPPGAQVKAITIPTMSEEEYNVALARTEQEWARVVLPHGWEQIEVAGPLEGCKFARRGMTSVVFSAGLHEGRWWLHVSVAHPAKLPPYMDVAEVKRIFVGRDRQAIHVFPREAEHVNIHPRALHLWASLEPAGDGLPAFGAHGTI